MFNSEDGALVLCGARSKRNEGRACRQPAMKNGRCRLHGGKSTGPKTVEGRKKSKMAVLKHGFYSIEIAKLRELIFNVYKLYKIKN